jgi:hypothetical protein
MISRQKLESRIRQKEEEIQEFELKIREAKSYLQALGDMLKLIPKEGNGKSAEQTLRPGTEVAKAREAILAAGKALHISAIVEATGKENTKKTRVALGGSLAGYVRKGQVFTRPAPNTFGLAELEEMQKSADEQPPENFGRPTLRRMG